MTQEAYPYSAWVAFNTIVMKEIRRFTRIWVQTLLPPAITVSLYFLIFGHLIGSRIGQMKGHEYVHYIIPGLIMMSVITNAYGNVVASFFSAKFQHSVEELLVSPTPNWVILAGYVVGGICRGLCVGIIVTAMTLVFYDYSVVNIGLTLTVLLLTASLFSLAGFINAVFAKKFDDISIVPTFILTPLTYLGGVFYSIDMLPDFWQKVSLLNPVVYMINAFRYGVLGESDVSIGVALGMIVLFNVAFFWLALGLLRKGVGIRH